MMYNFQKNIRKDNEGKIIYSLHGVMCLMYDNSISMLGLAKKAPAAMSRVFFQSPYEFSAIYM